MNRCQERKGSPAAMLPYSVLMSVYAKENPEFLISAIESMRNQTLPFHDFVLVCDGPLPDSLMDAIFHEKKLIGSTFTLVRLPQNLGLGPALNNGMKYCRCDLIARMDSDDISELNRCEREVNCFEATPELSIVSGFLTEFESDPSVPGPIRRVPKSDAEIRDFAKSRNPFNHPCVMYRKSAVQTAGGYQSSYPYFEDYDLWLRMIWSGAKGYNLQENLLFMRTGNGMYRRRSGKSHYKSAQKLFRAMLDRGYISQKEYCSALARRWIGDFMPNALRKFLYRRLLRS
jgi:glycosyltransferase involved in cell wall biosynthesis